MRKSLTHKSDEGQVYVKLIQSLRNGAWFKHGGSDDDHFLRKNGKLETIFPGEAMPKKMDHGKSDNC